MLKIVKHVHTHKTLKTKGEPLTTSNNFPCNTHTQSTQRTAISKNISLCVSGSICVCLKRKLLVEV